MREALRCRSCGFALEYTFVDLGFTPLANSYRDPCKDESETTYPLHVRVCSACYLVQLPQVATPDELFRDYAYYSSYSSTWLEHSRQFAERTIELLALSSDSLVVEVASNDGYLLRNYQCAGVPVLGVEPARNVARDAVAAGIPTEAEFFGTEFAASLAERGFRADLLVGNNVLAHVPDINDFVGGLGSLLKPDGVLSMEFPHVLELIDKVQYDTIYHEHFSYLSLLAVEPLFARHGLTVFDVERFSTHGGSLRVSACLASSDRWHERPSVEEIRNLESAAGLRDLDTYLQFGTKVNSVRDEIRRYLESAERDGKKVAAYGAAAKGNTLLNSIGATPELVQFVVDRNPHKQGLLMPGSDIPIHSPEAIDDARPDVVLILPWNLRDEIVDQLIHIRSWGGQFVTAIPEVRVF